MLLVPGRSLPVVVVRTTRKNPRAVITLPEGIFIEYLLQPGACPHHDHQIRPDMLFYQLVHAIPDFMCCKSGINACVTALDAGTHVAETGPAEHIPELPHRYFVFTARHDMAEEDTIGFQSLGLFLLHIRSCPAHPVSPAGERSNRHRVIG